MRFLLVDQEFESRAIVKKLLRGYGEVDIAFDGEECVVAFCSALKEGEPYDLIALDVFLPNMDSENTLREIRQIEREYRDILCKPTKIILASTMEETKDLYNAFYFGENAIHFTKPIDHNKLIREVKKLTPEWQ